MESTFEKIMRKTGTKPIACKCTTCKRQCTSTPCLGTPEDIIKLIDAGYADRLAHTVWAAGAYNLGVTNELIEMVQPLFDKQKGACTFFQNGLCELHEKGLKPTEGKLSSHMVKLTNKNAKKALSWAVAKEWMNVPVDQATLLSSIKFL